MTRNTLLKAGVTTLAALGLAASVPAFAQGTIYVEQVGDGSAALSSAGTPIFLDQYNTSGVAGTSLDLTTAGTNTLVDSGTAGSEGGLTQSGNFLTFAGYDAAVGTTGVATSTATRGVGIYNVTTGSVDTTTALTDAYQANNIRTAATANGSTLYTAGTAGSGKTATSGIRTATDGGTTTTALETSSLNTRYVGIYNGNLYFSTGSATGVGAVGIYQLGTGLPTASSALPITPTAIAADSHLASPYDFVFANNGSTLYVSDSTNGVVKYSLSGGTATYQYTIALPNATGLAFGGTDALGNNILYAVNGAAGTAANSLFSLDDTSSAATPTMLATAAANESFHGVAFIPAVAAAPEPSGVVALALGAGVLGLMVARRRKVAA